MLLAIDVGNTNIVLGVFEGSTLVRSWRLVTLRERTADEIGVLVTGLFAHAQLDPADVDAIALASVVPPLTGTVMAMGEHYFGVEPFSVDGSVDTGMPVLYDNPAEVGADRIVNGVAAYEAFGRDSQRAIVVVDFGTATTFDAISRKGEYLGGVICPGVQISADALFQRAARLPRIDVKKPGQVIGRTTVGSMQSGLYFGYVDMVEGLVRRVKRELGAPVYCVATGGLAEVIAPETSEIDAVSPNLTLDGLRIVWERRKR